MSVANVEGSRTSTSEATAVHGTATISPPIPVVVATQSPTNEQHEERTDRTVHPVIAGSTRFSTSRIGDQPDHGHATPAGVSREALNLARERRRPRTCSTTLT
jgi:hypothetical protein